jgi:putative hemolysin
MNPLDLSQAHPTIRFLAYRLFKLGVLKRWYDHWLHTGASGAQPFLNYVLGKVGADTQVENIDALEALPKDKALIIVANHPLGALEGMYLAQQLLRFRPDLKVLTNELLLQFKEFEDLFIGVDVLNPGKQQLNAQGMRKVTSHLRSGGALLMFPAGTVSQLSKNGVIQDSPWKPIVGRLALKYNTLCLPVFIQGQNNFLFYASGWINKRLRTLLLPRAMLAQKNQPVTTVIGQPVSVTETGMGTPETVTEYLRLACELLNSKQPPLQTDTEKELLSTSIDKHKLQLQIDELADCSVFSRDDFEVYCAPFNGLGCLAEYLAIEREKTFRAVGEGTGLSSDVDEYDYYYWHIFVWDKSKHQLVGGYRAINVADVQVSKGVVALYSHSLFHYDQQFITKMHGAIEVGRSFVVEAYQGSPHALDFLWRGLGAFMLKNKQCHTLFGCVSISKSFAPMVKALMVDTLLSGHSADQSIRSLVKPVEPFNYSSRFWSKDIVSALSNVKAVNKLLGRVGSQLRIPILIRHYLALNGKFIDFTVNAGFNESLDGLIVVDLRNAPNKYLVRYLGDKGSALFLKRWRNKDAA